MLQIQTCTLTGADDHTPVDRLVKLHQSFPIAEFGILLGDSPGTPRYPTNKWIQEFVKRYRGPKAIHLCGKQVGAFLAKDVSLLALAANFNRIQLNFNLAQKPELLAELPSALAVLKPNQAYIVQINGNNEGLAKHINGTKDFHCLFDSSGGAGITPGTWPEPLPGKYCGYAGGLGPDTLEDQLERIGWVIASSGSSRRIWIDLESKLRSADDQFSIEKAQAALVTATRYNRQHHG